MRREALAIALVVAAVVLIALVGELLREWRRKLHVSNFGSEDQ